MIRIQGGTQTLRRTVNARLATLAARLGPDHTAWRAPPEGHRTQARLTFDLLAHRDPDSATGGPTEGPE